MTASRSLGAARIAVVGAESARGTLIRAALEERRVDGARVDLYAAGQSADGEALLGEYAGEARLIQAPEFGEIADHDLIFLCRSGDAARRVLRECEGKAIVLDVAHDHSDGGSVALLDGSRMPAPGTRGCFAVPHPISGALLRWLAPVVERFDLERVLATILRPASDFGEPGVDELREQTVRLLNFTRTPHEVFGRQLAFNLIPNVLIPAAEAGLETRLANELRRILGRDRPRIAVQLIAAPIFFGHAWVLHLDPGPSVDREDLAAALLGAGAEERDSPETPVEVTGERRMGRAHVAADGIGGLWVWVVAGEIESAGAEHAVALAAKLLAE